MSKLSNIFESKKSRRPLVLGVLLIVAILAVSAASVLLYNQLTRDQDNKLSNVPVEYMYKNHMYDFVANWGTYNSVNYDSYTQTIKPQLTNDFYRSEFNDSRIVQKKEQLSKSNANYLTLPISSVDGVKLVNSGNDGFEAEIVAEEQNTQPDGKILYDLISYRVKFVKQDGKLLASQVAAERESEPSEINLPIDND